MKKYILILTLLTLWLTPVRIRADVDIKREAILNCGTLKGKEISVKDLKHDYIDVILTGYDNDYACTGKTPSSKGYGVTGSGVRASRGSVAAPSGISLGTRIHITGGNVYPDRTVEDRGGAINVINGVYHFDLWFPTHSEAKAFGVKKAKGYWIGKDLYIDIE